MNQIDSTASDTAKIYTGRRARTRMVRLHNNKPGGMFKTRDGREYGIAKNGSIRRADSGAALTKKQRNKAKREARISA